MSRDSDSFAWSASSRCTGPNTDRPYAFATALLDLRLDAKGPVVTGAMLGFIESFESQNTAIPEFSGGAAERVPFTLEVGQTIQASQIIARWFDSRCVAAGAGTTTSSSTSTSTSSPPSDEPQCPPGQQPDPVGDNESSGRASSAEPDPGHREASDVACFGISDGSIVFTMTVVGDGRAMSTAEHTKWYNPRFIVNNDPATNSFEDPGGFFVDVGWDRNGEPEAQVFDAEDNDVGGAKVGVEWLDSSTLQVTVEMPDGDPEVNRARVELSVRTRDAEGNTVSTFGDDAFWEAGG